MRRWLSIGLMVAAGVVAVLFWLWKSGRLLRAPTSAGVSTATSNMEEKEFPPVPNLSLEINRQTEVAATQGTPFIFGVLLDNPQATNAAMENESKHAYVANLREKMKRGEVVKDQGEARIAASRERPVQNLRLGDEQSGPESFIQFVQQSADGSERPLGWAIKRIGAPLKLPVVLDGENTAEIDYAVDPGSGASIPAGEYRIIAVLEAPASAKLPESAWRGRVESEPVTVKISPGPPRGAAKEKMELDLANYFYTTEDFASALTHAQTAASADPSSIAAWTIVGDASEQRGDLERSLAAYEHAETEVYKQYPKSYEAPEYLIAQIGTLREKIAAKR